MSLLAALIEAQAREQEEFESEVAARNRSSCQHATWRSTRARWSEEKQGREAAAKEWDANRKEAARSRAGGIRLRIRAQPEAGHRGASKTRRRGSKRRSRRSGPRPRKALEMRERGRLGERGRAAGPPEAGRRVPEGTRICRCESNKGDVRPAHT